MRLIDADKLIYQSHAQHIQPYINKKDIDNAPTVEMAEDCISRQATIDAIYKKHVGGKDAIENAPINDLYAYGLEEAIDAVEDSPSVQPQPKRGKWGVIRKEYEFMGGIVNEAQGCRCSNCGEIVKFKSNFCPSCSAKMEAKTDDEP